MTGRATTCRRILVVACALLGTSITSTARAELRPIVLDGLFEDWDGLAPLVEDGGDNPDGGVDFGRLWVADDDTRLFLRIEVGRSIHLDEHNDIHLYLDTDGDTKTGLAVGGIGAEVDFHLGRRSGTVHEAEGTRSVRHRDLGLIGMPTVTSAQFEIGLEKARLSLGSGEVRIVLRDTSGDQLPDPGSTLVYPLGVGESPPVRPRSLGREAQTDFRMITYNVLRDAPWRNQVGRLGRQLTATAPDIINLQEVYETSIETVLSTVTTYLPLPEGQVWDARRVNDCITVSRYPILGSWAIDQNLGILLDLTEAAGAQLLVINAHLPCCANDSGRQHEVNQILDFIREARRPERGRLDLVENTPIVVVGDMNFVGFSSQLESLLSGDLLGGWDFDPDWDGSRLTNLVSLLTEDQVAYTWRDDSLDFWPGHLDFVIFSDSVLEADNHFVLRTDRMSRSVLETHGLRSTDSDVSDHLLVCADFHSTVAIDPPDGAEPPVASLRALPNPLRGDGAIQFRIETDAEYLVEVFHVSGRRVALPMGPEAQFLPSGTWRFGWDGHGLDDRPLPAGSYWLRLRRTGEDRLVESNRFIVLR